MKLVIDIDENIWEMVVNTGTFGCYRFNTSRAIRKGVPLEKIRDEIESQREEVSKKHSEDEGLSNFYYGLNDGLKDARDIIDKYRESEKV